jgi:hypothetical protein
MDPGKASTVICLTLFAVIAVNVLIYFAFRGGIKFHEIDAIQKFTDRSHQPWRKDQEDLDELSKLVENLKQPIEQNEDKRKYD